MQEFQRKLNSQKPGPDSRSFAKFYMFVRIIRLWFKLNNFKLCKPIFQQFE